MSQPTDKKPEEKPENKLDKAAIDAIKANKQQAIVNNQIITKDETNHNS